jgi:general secretion pathway protein H
MLAVVDTDAAGRGAGGARPARRRGEAGFSLIEILVVLTIVSVVSAGTIIGFRSLIKSELRSQASKLAAAIRYSYDRAISTGAYYRLHLNLDDQTYQLERSENRVLLWKSEEAGRKGRGLDLDKENKKAEQEERAHSNLPKELTPPSPRRPKFAEYKDSTLPKVRLGRIKILDLFTPRQPEPYQSGHAYLHFFPDGHTERAIIHLGLDAADDSQYTLRVYGLTGRVEILPGRVPPPADFDPVDSGLQRGSP